MGGAWKGLGGSRECLLSRVRVGSGQLWRLPAQQSFSVTSLPPHLKPMHRALEATATLAWAGSLLDKLPLSTVDHKPRWDTGPCHQPGLTIKGLMRSGKALPQRFSASSNLIVGSLFCNC